MRNIRKSIFLTMIVVTCVSGMDEFSPAAQTMKTLSGLQNMILSMDHYQKQQQRAMEVHNLNQQIDMENHNLDQQIASDTHKINQLQAKDRLKMANDNHRVHQQKAKCRQQVDSDNHATYQRSVIDKQLLGLKKQRRERKSQEEASWVTYHENQTKIALAKAELRKVEAETEQIKTETEKSKAENAFSQCLVNHRHSPDLGRFGIPKVCEDPAKILRLLGCGSKVDDLIEEFQK